ncbi:MAG: HAD family hydrolase [Sphingobium sp.]|uniref:HAD family hydrolase n=1 Tax=Sphingobium sp. TaxID=1912891 RepID=UPI00299FCCB5|nr:HAD family hydrolase [Sphingobium sp.]MDX3909596.1 HAD family hydrolase [Sphingobium sp.]
MNEEGRREPGFDRVIVFDLDDTLYLERRYVESGLKAVGAWAHARLGLEKLGPLMLERFAAGSRTHIFDDSLAALDVVPPPGTIERMLNVYRQHRPDISLEADADHFLRNPPPRTAFAIITDGFLDAQRRKIRALDLYRRGVRLGVCTDCWGRECWKPNPRAYLHLQQFFALPPERFTYIADNPLKDFHAPTVLGWHTVRIARAERLHLNVSGQVIDASKVIENLEQF